MADFEHRQFEIGLEFVRWSFAEHYNFSEGFSEPKKDAQVIQVQGAAARVFSLELLVLQGVEYWYSETSLIQHLYNPKFSLIRPL